MLCCTPVGNLGCCLSQDTVHETVCGESYIVRDTVVAQVGPMTLRYSRCGVSAGGAGSVVVRRTRLVAHGTL